MDDLFPRKEGVDLTQLQTTPEGLYSITRRRDALRILGVMRSMLPTMHLTITDATACIGGDTLNFALHFSHVQSVEQNADNFQALANNVNVYGFTNVTLHHADVTTCFDWKTDVLYVDPPWGGKDYKQHTDLDVWLGEIRLDHWLAILFEQTRAPPYIFLKLPTNYAFHRLASLPATIKQHPIRSYVLVSILM